MSHSDHNYTVSELEISPEHKAKEQKQKEMLRSSGKIMLIDDNDDIVQLLRTLLESVGYEVTTSLSGKEGLDLIVKGNFDLVLLDITMPDFSGFDVVTSLQNSNDLEKNNIIFFTAADVPESEIEKWMKLGIKGCLKKPIEPATLFEKINEVEPTS